MQVNQRLERAIRAGEQPVDRSLLIAFDMVVEEVAGEVSTDVFASASSMKARFSWK